MISAKLASQELNKMIAVYNRILQNLETLDEKSCELANTSREALVSNEVSKKDESAIITIGFIALHYKEFADHVFDFSVKVQETIQSRIDKQQNIATGRRRPAEAHTSDA